MNNTTEFVASITATIQDQMRAWEIPACSIGIIQKDQILLNRGFGYLSQDSSRPVDEHTLFAIGSNTKAFTAAALGVLVDEGKLAWDDRVSKYLPSYGLNDPLASQLVTVRDLLCHRAGLGTWSGDLISYGSIYTREEVLSKIRHIPLAYPFRSGYGYCNLNFLAAGMIIPVVSGLEWDQFLRERIFIPAGMDRTFTNLHAAGNDPNVARPHEKVGDTVQQIAARDISNHGPAGSMYSCTSDLLLWLQIQLNDGQIDGKQILPANTVSESRQPNTPIRIDETMRQLNPFRNFQAYGLGWFLMDYRGVQVVFHTGGVDGMLSLVGMVPALNLGVTVLTNKLPNFLYNALFFQIMDAFLDAPDRDWHQIYHEYSDVLDRKEKEKLQQVEDQRTGALPSLALEGYCGRYLSDVYGQAEIRLVDGSLQISLGGHPNITGRLEHWDTDIFNCRWSDPVFWISRMPFSLSAEGGCEFSFKVREDWIDPLEYHFRKISI